MLTAKEAGIKSVRSKNLNNSLFMDYVLEKVEEASSEGYSGVTVNYTMRPLDLSLVTESLKILGYKVELVFPEKMRVSWDLTF